MRINEAPQVPRIRTGLMEWVDEWLRAFAANWLRIAQQLNGVSEGRIAPWHTAHTTYPVAGKYDQGDFVRNSTPTVAGVVPCDYIVMGWVCTVGGTPGRRGRGLVVDHQRAEVQHHARLGHVQRGQLLLQGGHSQWRHCGQFRGGDVYRHPAG
jgi:hypothetical protein